MNRLKPDCLTCLMNRYLTQFPPETSEEKQLEYMQRLFHLFANASPATSAPLLSREIFKIQKELFQMKNEYGKIKSHFNEVMMQYTEKVQQTIKEAKDPLKLALQYAMVGNYIDFGAMKNVDTEYLNHLLENAEDTSVNAREYENLKRDFQRGNNLVYLTDNCGEIVMDKILIETLKELYPHLNITVIVRGGEVLNDASLKDAQQIGLDKIVKVIDSGTAIAGTCLEEIKGEPLTLIKQADLLLAKGQGNFETMQGCNLNVYYLFLCKCNMFAKDFGVERFTGMLINDRNHLNDLHQ